MKPEYKAAVLNAIVNIDLLLSGAGQPPDAETLYRVVPIRDIDPGEHEASTNPTLIFILLGYIIGHFATEIGVEKFKEELPMVRKSIHSINAVLMILGASVGLFTNNPELTHVSLKFFPATSLGAEIKYRQYKKEIENPPNPYS